MWLYHGRFDLISSLISNGKNINTKPQSIPSCTKSNMSEAARTSSPVVARDGGQDPSIFPVYQRQNDVG